MRTIHRGGLIFARMLFLRWGTGKPCPSTAAACASLAGDPRGDRLDLSLGPSLVASPVLCDSPLGMGEFGLDRRRMRGAPVGSFRPAFVRDEGAA